MLLLEHLFGPRGGDIRSAWGYRFAWTPHHKTAEELLVLRSHHDELADRALDRLNAVRDKRDLYTALEEEHGNGRGDDGDGDVLRELWMQTQSIPEWVDWDQIERGQKVVLPPRSLSKRRCLCRADWPRLRPGKGFLSIRFGHVDWIGLS